MAALEALMDAHYPKIGQLTVGCHTIAASSFLQSSRESQARI
jgi:hypothetical protein